MTLKARFALLLAFVTLLLAGGVLWLDHVHRREALRIAEVIRRERAELLARTLPLLDYPLHHFVTATCRQKTLGDSIRISAPNALYTHLENDLSSHGLTAAWVFDASGQLHCFARSHEQTHSPSLKQDAWSSKNWVGLLNEPVMHSFYDRIGDGVFAMAAAPFPASSDEPQAATPAGWIIAAHEVDADYLSSLQEFTASRIALLAAGIPATQPSQSAAPSRVEFALPLADLTGAPIATLHLEHRPQLLSRAFARDKTIFMVFQSVLAVIILMVAVQRWVLSPFKVISKGLATTDPTALRPLIAHRSEIGQIARLVVIHFAHQKVVTRTAEERARLARDLHDGVIQSIYATGMRLASLKSLIVSDPATAKAHIEEIRHNLNEIIHETRVFIAGLEPDDLRDQPFAHLVQNLVTSLKPIREIRTVLSIEENAARRLSPAAKAQVLQMIREALSNTLRHSEAREVRITLAQRNTTLELTIQDDGQGFDLSEQANSGHGLTNLNERARTLGGTASIESAPHKGTRILIILPLKSA
jgi:signal transduction histidine kinase